MVNQFVNGIQCYINYNLSRESVQNEFHWGIWHRICDTQCYKQITNLWSKESFAM